MPKPSGEANRLETEDWRTMTPEEKLRRMEELSRSVIGTPRTEQELAEVAEVRERWNRLRKAYGAF